MILLFYYTNLIRAIVVVATAVQLIRHNYKKIALATVTIALTFIPWLLSLIHIQLNDFTVFLFQTVVFLAAFLGLGYKYYDSFPGWIGSFISLRYAILRIWNIVSRNGT